MSAFTFISPVSSSMVAPASDQLAASFGITNNAVIALTTSIFVLAYGAFNLFPFRDLRSHICTAFGPLFLGPLSEIFGRSRVLQIANLWYLGTPISPLCAPQSD